MSDTNTTYTKAVEELEKILAELRSDQCDIDTLTEKTRRAATLLTECRARLTATEQELTTILTALESEN